MRFSCVILLTASLILAACDRRATSPEPVAAAAAVPEGFLLADAPAGAKDVAAVAKEAKHGDEVILRGRIGGRMEPFVADRAVMLVIDPSIKACSENPGDAYTTPWDVCCEPSDNLLAGSASVQVVDADGRPLRGGLKGVGGLQPLSTVIIRGKAVRPEGSKTLTVNATALHVVK